MYNKGFMSKKKNVRVLTIQGWLILQLSHEKTIVWKV